MTDREWADLVAVERKRADEAEQRAAATLRLMMDGEAVRGDMQRLAVSLACKWTALMDRLDKLEREKKELLDRLGGEK